MKRNGIFLSIIIAAIAIITLSLFPALGFAADALQVTLSTSGALEADTQKAAGYTDDDNITSITVTGAALNAEDWSYLNSLKNIQTIDLSGAQTDRGEIPQSAMSGNTTLQSIRLPENTETIEKSAFEGCSALRGDIRIPESVFLIGDSAFQNAGFVRGAGTLVFEGTPKIDVIGSYAFAQSTISGALNLPDSVASIGSYAFYNCEQLTAVNLPQGGTVKSIQPYTFAGCYRVTSALKIPSSVIEIGQSAFESFANQSSTEPLLFASGSNIGTIAEKAFIGSSIAGPVILPDSINLIGAEAFAHCYNITSIAFPNNANLSIGSDAFTYDIALRSFVFKADYKAVGSGAFSSCALDLSGNTPEGRALSNYTADLTSIAGNQRPYYIVKAPEPFTMEVSQISEIKQLIQPDYVTMYGNQMEKVLKEPWIDKQIDWQQQLANYKVQITQDGQTAEIDKVGIYNLNYTVPAYIYAAVDPDSTTVTVIDELSKVVITGTPGQEIHTGETFTLQAEITPRGAGVWEWKYDSSAFTKQGTNPATFVAKKDGTYEIEAIFHGKIDIAQKAFVEVTVITAPSASETPAPTVTPTPAPTSSSTPAPTRTPEPTVSATPVPTHTPVPTASPTPAPTHTPVPTHTPTPTASPTPAPTHTSEPTVSATPVPTASASAVPTRTPVPSVSSTPEQTQRPSVAPSVKPTPTGTETPSAMPTQSAAPAETETAASTPPPETQEPEMTTTPTATATQDDQKNTHVLPGHALLLRPAGPMPSIEDETKSNHQEKESGTATDSAQKPGQDQHSTDNGEPVHTPDTGMVLWWIIALAVIAVWLGVTAYRHKKKHDKK